MTFDTQSWEIAYTEKLYNDWLNVYGKNEDLSVLMTQ